MLSLNALIDLKDKAAEALLMPNAKVRGLDGGKNGLLAGNAVGFGVGFKEKGGKLLESVALVALVRVKLLPEYCGEFLMPQLLHNVLGVKLDPDELDVVETGNIGSLGGLAGPINQLTIGADVVMAGRTTHGTVCGFVTYKDQQSVHLLSCGHVLDGRKLFKRVASRDAVVADICDESPLWPGFGVSSVTNIDAAIAKLRDDVTPNYKLPFDLGYMNRPTPKDAYLDMTVKKAGKTQRDGAVRCTNASVSVDYASQTSILKNQLLVRSLNHEVFAEAGDSGALVMTRVHHREWWPVGMVVAAGDPATLSRDPLALSPRWSVVSPLQPILDDLKAELIIA